MSQVSPYQRIYADLVELRESFHRSGRLDDSNAKLDEVAKIFATYLAFKKGQIESFPAGQEPEIIRNLQKAFSQTVELPHYVKKSGDSIFGAQPGLILRLGDEALAAQLVALVRGAVDAAFDAQEGSHPFDILNEAFGHFVRDNFRGNVEDAQYMTPPEVVEFMVDVALKDCLTKSGGDFVVVDPSCGVGSFLTTFYQKNKIAKAIDPEKVKLVGQDKVERMVRLSTINMELFDVGKHEIFTGNSLKTGSDLDAYNGKVDLVLTNPPFGAKFGPTEIADEFGTNTPFFSSLKRSGGAVDSELLFVDRNLRLLKPGGALLIVVPDGVISAKGIAAMLRHTLMKTCTVVAVVELPSTAFAQAGTRTKTAVLYLKKEANTSNAGTFMASVSDLGYQVAARKGVQVKLTQGSNELPAVGAAFELSHPWRMSGNEAQVVREIPSSVVIPAVEVSRNGWTPNHFSAKRIQSIAALRRNPGLELVELNELVDFCPRESARWQPGHAFISVLHILGDGFIDIAGALSYAPKTPGLRTSPGEVLMSRINPRIPRVCVTPDLGMPTLCSGEFEVMRCRAGIDEFAVVYLLQTQAVQNQIQSMTSGTSASHNRVRTSELANVLIPMPRIGTKGADDLEAVLSSYRSAAISLSTSAMTLASLRQNDCRIFGSFG